MNSTKQIRKKKGGITMKETNKTIKECIECGGEFQEKQKSIHFECEHCIGRHEE